MTFDTLMSFIAYPHLYSNTAINITNIDHISYVITQYPPNDDSHMISYLYHTKMFMYSIVLTTFLYLYSYLIAYINHLHRCNDILSSRNSRLEFSPRTSLIEMIICLLHIGVFYVLYDCYDYFYIFT